MLGPPADCGTEASLREGNGVHHQRDAGSNPASNTPLPLCCSSQAKSPGGDDGALLTRIGNGLVVNAYRCVDVAGRNRKNGSASNIPIASGCHPANAMINVDAASWFLS